MDQITAAPESHNRRTPVVVESAPNSGAAESPRRATVKQRAIITPLPWRGSNKLTTYPIDHPYVRLYWTATIGPGAVADMMRLATAAIRGRSLRRPTHLHVLVRTNLVHTRSGHVYVRTTIPELNILQVRLLPPDLRRQHPDMGLRT